MNITEKIDGIESLIVESGIRNMSEIAKKYTKATIYFHKDLDGVCSCLGLKQYLENYGIKTIAAWPLNYGSEEYAIPMPEKGTIACLVDFSHGKSMMKIWLDHHDNDHPGGVQGQSTSFVHTKSNAEYITQILSPHDLFPIADIAVISTVDSADFARLGLTPDDIMRSAFHTNKQLDVTTNKQAMGLVVNKLLLSYKNKDSFLSDLVMQANPSLLSMYNTIKKLAIKNGYKTPEDITADTETYVGKQEKNVIKNGTLNDIKTLKNGQSILFDGKIIVQYGGGYMGKGNQYDRYVPFKLHPTADFYCIAWSMGLLQITKSPFKKHEDTLHLGEFAKNIILPKFKERIDKPVTLDYVKYLFEKDAKEGDMGVTWNDIVALYKDVLNGLGSEKWNGMIEDITNKPYKFLSVKQRDILKKVTISGWDLVQKGSGGHSGITNVSGVAFLGKGYTDLLHDMQYETVKELQKIINK